MTATSATSATSAGWASGGTTVRDVDRIRSFEPLVAGSRPAVARTLRLLPIPEHRPPTLASWRDVEPTVSPSGYVQGVLAVDPHDDDEAAFGPRPTSALALPEPTEWAARIAQALVEVLSGTRPAPQLIRWTAGEVYSTIARRHALALTRQHRSVRRPVVRRVRICQPADGVLEACAVVVEGGRARAVAMRFEGRDGRWVMSQLEIG